jgi:phage/plasmid-like protein (TIGR03299 family)
MAHEIMEQDRFGEVGKLAWHGLGIEIPAGLSAQEGFEKIGLGWRTTLAPVFAEIEGMGPDGPCKTRLEIPERKAHYRSDNNEFLGMVSSDYRALENQDLARFADALSDAEQGNVVVETAGSLHNGRRIFACVKLPEQVCATADDVMDQYVLVSNGHGGFASFACYPTSVRVVCANTLRWSEADVARGMRFFHLGSMEEKLKNARTALGIARKETERFQEQVSALVGLKLTNRKMRNLAEDIYMRCFGKIDDHMEPEFKEKALAKMNEVVGEWMKNLDDEKQRLSGIEGSGWAFYNAVSQWHDHQRGYFKSVTESNSRVSSNIFGVSNEHKRKAFRRVLAAV